jgi:hypothetical protein
MILVRIYFQLLGFHLWIHADAVVSVHQASLNLPLGPLRLQLHNLMVFERMGILFIHLTTLARNDLSILIVLIRNTLRI